MNKMQIILNNNPQELAEGTTLRQFIQEIGYTDSHGVAVAVNQKIISKDSWANYVLENNDHITLFRATCGG